MKIKALDWKKRRDGGFFAFSPATPNVTTNTFRIAYEEGKYYCIWSCEGEMLEGYDDPQPIMDEAQRLHEEFIMQFLEE